MATAESDASDRDPAAGKPDGWKAYTTDLAREHPPEPVDGVYDVAAMSYALGIPASYLRTILTSPARRPEIVRPGHRINGGPVWTRDEARRTFAAVEKLSQEREASRSDTAI